jgi:GDP-mannose pyrophosphatase NudK
MSPGSVTEIVHFFAAEYDQSQRAYAGGGVDDEDIEVVELPFTQAIEMIKDGRIKDGKTIMLLQYAQTQGWMA